MQRIFSLGVYAPIRYIIIIALVLPGWQIMYGQDTPKFQNSGNKPKPPKIQAPLDSVVSWNILFRQNTNAAARALAIGNVKDSLTSYYLLNYPRIKPVFDSAIYCPCDSLLYNLNVRFVDGQDGGSLSSPTPPKPGPAGTGDYVAIQHISNNNFVEEMEPDGRLDTAHKHPIALSFLGNTYYNKSVLAVIDTGIDTTLFPPNFSRLIWRRSGPGNTMYNFLPHQNTDSLRDDHRGRHGTLVTALALKAYATGVINPTYPRIMILKALDAKKRGSVFSVSCALSYARQNNATVVNASLGYLGESDPVLRYYIKQCDNSANNPILIFAAAGNMPGERTVDLCHTPRLDNQLTDLNTFYPACWSTQLKHVITITGLNGIGQSCYYQNYSNKFVSLGVKNIFREDGQVQGTCGSYKAPFNGYNYEGSSLATPIACGLLMRNMRQRGLNTRQLILAIAFPGNGPTGNIINQGPPLATRGGKYLVFPIKH
jgi:hypothetical protein